MTTETLTAAEIEELRRLEREAFRAPWTYSQWEVECPCEGGSEYDCTNKECDGSHVPCTTIESPDEYPDGQIVAQFQVPGLSCLADKNGAFMVALRNAAPALLSLAASALEARWVPVEERLPDGNPREVLLWVRTSDGGYQICDNWKPGWACPRYISHWRERISPPPPGKDGEP